MLNEVIKAMITAGAKPDRDHLRKCLPAVARAIEAYELGLPKETEQPQRNESLVDRHMMP
jgi:hypothetical protein